VTRQPISGSRVGSQSVAPVPVKPVARGQDYLLRPGSIDRSTSLWFVIPAGVVLALESLFLWSAERFEPTLVSGNVTPTVLLAGSLGVAVWAYMVKLSQKEEDARDSTGKFESLVRHEFWRARTVAWGMVAIGVVVSGLVLFIWSGLASAVPVVDVPFVELGVLVLTVLLLSILTRYTAMAFRTDADASVVAQREEMDRVRTSFSQETTRLLERNAEHWREQSNSLERAVQSMEQVAALQRQTLQATQQTLATTAALLDLERQRETLRIEEARLRLQRIRPSIAVRGVISHPGIIAKHIVVRLFNQGEEGRRVLVAMRYGSGPNELQTRSVPSIGAFSNVEVDFGDIDGWADNFGFAVEVTADDVDGHRYGCSTRLRYARNRGLLGSEPSIDPDDWQYPAVEPVVPG
jgi:hypothetical protein